MATVMLTQFPQLTDNLLWYQVANDILITGGQVDTIGVHSLACLQAIFHDIRHHVIFRL